MKTQIYLNQVGYITGLAKTAAVISNIKSFSLCEKSTDETVYTGKLSKPVFDAASGDNVSTADFSGFERIGEYYLKVGLKKSYSFIISNNPYSELKQLLLKAYYYNRCGITIHSKYAGEFKRKKCHTEMASLYSEPAKKLDVSGGWHDAGDYGRYVCTAATALGHLLYAYEMFPESFNDTINIPESGNGIPDILNECRYELEWLLKMQDKDGGVYHKAATSNFAENVMPADDTEELFVYNKSAAAAADFSAVTALASRIYKKFDLKFSKRLEVSAINAGAWFINNANSKPFENPYKCKSSEYSDNNYNDDIFWNVSELYQLTGESSFNKKLCEIYDKIDTTAFVWDSLGGFGAISYFLSNRPKNQQLVDALKTAFIYKADNLLSMSQHSGYKTVKEGNSYISGSNMDILTNAMTLIIANKISPNVNYINTALEQANYILGKNPMGISYVTGVGGYFSSHPHHRPCTADGIDAPISGMVVGGPDMLRQDSYSRWLIPKGTPPAKCYIDKEYSYATNEVGICYNSCAVFVFGYLSSDNNLWRESYESK